jgi:hypothetical protein
VYLPRHADRKSVISCTLWPPFCCNKGLIPVTGPLFCKYSRRSGDCVKRSQPGTDFGQCAPNWRRLTSAMMIHLVSVRQLCCSICSRDSPSAETQPINRAKAHYLILRWHSAAPAIHLPYLSALLSTRTSHGLSEAVQHLSRLMRAHTYFPAPLAGILWQIASQTVVDVPRDLRVMLLFAIQQRIMKSKSALFHIEREVTRNDHNGFDFVSVFDLGKAIRHAIFSTPSLLPSEPSPWPPEVTRWAVLQADAAFKHRLPAALRWRHLTLLALSSAPPSLTSLGNEALIQSGHIKDTRSSSWRTVCALSALQASLCSDGSVTSEPSVAEHTRYIIRALWRSWKAAHDERPAIVAQVIMASFLDLAGRIRDVALKDACHRYCASHDLWTPMNSSNYLGRQAQTLAAEYVIASVACGTCQWRQLFSPFQAQADSEWLAGVACMSLSRLIHQRDVENALSLFKFMRYRGMQLSGEVVHSLAMALASTGHLEQVVPFLSEDFSQQMLQQLLGAVLPLLAQQADQQVRFDVASILSDVVFKLYLHSSPPPQFRSYIEYIIPVIAASGHPSKATSLVDAIHSNAPFYLRMSSLTRLLHVLLRKTHYPHAVTLLDVLAKHSRRCLTEFRRTLILSLTAARATDLATQASRIPISHAVPRDNSLFIARALRHRLVYPGRLHPLKIIPIISRSRSDAHTVHFALRALVHAGRMTAARRLFRETRANFGARWQTSMCNVILHGTLLRRSTRNRQRVKKLLKMIAFFIKEYGFVPDRITVNIMLKAFIQWTTVVDAPKLRVLFDHFIRIGGYPAGDYSSTGPFKTPVSAVPLLSLPKLPAHISFAKHVRPMYKLFIKGFTFRGDANAARKLSHILDAESAVARNAATAARVAVRRRRRRRRQPMGNHSRRSTSSRHSNQSFHSRVARI